MAETLNLSKSRQTLVLVLLATLLAGFALDLITPRGSGTWMIYFLVVVLSSRVAGKQGVLYFMAATASGFTVAGFLYSPPGVPIWVSASSRFLGLVLIWTIVWVDLKWRRANERLTRLQKAVDHSGEVVFMTDREGVITFVNPAFTSLYGYTPGEVVGRTTPRILKSEHIAPEVYDSFWKVLLDKRNVQGEIVNKRKDGRLLTVELSANPILDERGEITGFLGIQRDITERKRAEEALRESEEHFRSLFENMLNGFAYCRMVFEQDRTSDFIYLETNKAFETLTGLKNVTGKRVSEVIPGVRESDPGLLEIYGRVVRTGVPERFESYVEALGMWFSISVYSPKKEHFVAVFDVITERKRAEAALRASEIRYRRLFEAAKDGILILDHSTGNIVNVNPFLENLLGYPSQEMVGRKLWEIGAFRDAAASKVSFQELQDKGFVRYEDLPLQTNDGRVAEVEFVSNVYEVNGEKVIQCNIRDITERKQADAALRESEDRYRDLVEHSQDLIWTHDLQGKLLSVNPESARILGYSKDELLCMTMCDVLAPEVRCEFDGYLERIRCEGEHRGLLRVRTRDGIDRIWEYHNTLRTEGIPEPVVRGLARDITQQVEAEEALKKTQEQFLQAQKMEAVGRLAGGVAHDFNNLLTVINGYSDLMLESAPGGSSEHSHLEEIRRAGERAAALTRQLLAFSRKQVIEPRVLDLNAIVGGAQSMLRRLIGEDIEFIANLAKPLGQVKGDPGQVEQVIMNLVVNARDAMPKGGKLVIETANAELGGDYVKSHPYVAPGNYVMLALSDTGCGMDAETQSHIFEPFYTTKKQGKGTGLGLSTVYGIVKQSGGHVNVYSEAGQGTTLRIYFPRIDKPVEVGSEKCGENVSVLGTETILAVEDEPGVRSLIQGALRDSGYTVLVAAGSEEAVTLAAEHHDTIHLILTDVIMPGLNGKELAARLTLSRPEIKVLFISGYTADAIGQHGILEEGVAFLPKPFTLRDLLRKVRQTLDGTKS